MRRISIMMMLFLLVCIQSLLPNELHQVSVILTFSGMKNYNLPLLRMIADLYKYGVSLAELSSEYGIAKSTIGGRIKDTKEIKIIEEEVMTLKEVMLLKKEIGRIK